MFPCAGNIETTSSGVFLSFFFLYKIQAFMPVVVIVDSFLQNYKLDQLKKLKE